MGLGTGRVPQITLGLLLFAGCSEGDAESDDATASTASTASTGGTGGSGSTGASSSTTGGGSAPTGTQGQDTGSGDTTVTGGETGAPVGPGFAVDIWPILDARCSCHKDSPGAGMLRLVSDVAYVNLVGKPSLQAPLQIVEPGSAQDSYLWHKLNDTQLEAGGYGMRMPSGGLLDPAEREQIREWIDAGAHP